MAPGLPWKNPIFEPGEARVNLTDNYTMVMSIGQENNVCIENYCDIRPLDEEKIIRIFPLKHFPSPESDNDNIGYYLLFFIKLCIANFIVKALLIE